MRKTLLFLAVLLLGKVLTVTAQQLPADILDLLRKDTVVKKYNRKVHAPVSHPVVADPGDPPIVMDLCDDDLDGFTSINMDSISNEVLIRNGHTSFAEGIVISTLNGKIVKVNDLSTSPSVSYLCSGVIPLTPLTDIAVNQAGGMFVCVSGSIFSVRPDCTTSLLLFTTIAGVLNSLSFDRLDNLYFGGGSSIVARCDAGTFTPAIWHDFGSGFAGGDFVMLKDKMYISWVDGKNQLLEVTVDAANNYVSHIVLGELPPNTYGLASEMGKLYGVTPTELFRIDIAGGGFTTHTVTVNPTPADIWGGAAGLHEASAYRAEAFETLADATGLVNQLPSPWVNTVAGGQTIYVAVINIVTGDVEVFPVDLNIHVTPVSAGPDQTGCNTTATMAANTPAAGTGEWTLQSGTGTITTPSDPNTTITGLAPGDNIFKWTVTNTTCVASDLVTIHIDPPAVPTFAAFPPICSGGTAPLLPAVSTNGITGTWSPATVSNTTTADYTFTPNPGQCAAVTQITQTITPKATPDFTALPAICEGSTAPVLPTVSTNGINGAWSPATVSNTATGTYTFTPAAGECATIATITQEVTPKATPAFTALPPVCTGSPAPVLPTVSSNGISGTWSPATVSNTATGTYTFTPAAGECATATTLTQVITSKATPAFAALPDICSGAAAPVLPAVSANGISGTWSPATVSNTATGTYTFTPAAGECAVPAQLTQKVNSTVASFEPLAPVCKGGAVPVLSNVSTEGVSGTWSPAAIDNTITATYTFTPLPGGCALTPFTLTQQVNPLPVANAGTDGLAAIGIPYQLHASGGVSYEWITGASLLNDPRVADPKATVFINPTLFTVRVTDANGCTATDDVLIKLYNGYTYYIPNAFTPNGDSRNDVLKAIPAGIATTDYFNIYNRWGQLVFSTKNLANGWDGTFKGTKQPGGTYTWMIKGMSTKGMVIEMKGFVQLLR